jgi:hypothetical protein
MPVGVISYVFKPEKKLSCHKIRFCFGGVAVAHLKHRFSLALLCAFLLSNEASAMGAVEPASGAAVTRTEKNLVSAIPKKLLFLPFYNEANETNFAWLETSIGNGIHEAAQKKYRYVKIDDDTFARYFAAKGYTSADLCNFDKITKIAHDLGVDGVVYGTFRPDASKTNLVVTGKILSAIDHEIVAERVLTMPLSAEMFSVVEQVSQALGENIRNLFFPSDMGALKRAALLPGWGHWYKQRRDWAYVYGIAFWSSVAFTTFSAFQYFHYKSGYANLNPEHYTNSSGGTMLFNSATAQAEFDRYASNIATYGTLATAGAIAMGLIYAANLLHAWGIAPDVAESLNLVVRSPQTVGMPSTGRFAASMEISLLWKF